MKCPRCDRELTALSVEGVQVDACQNGCGGIWFDVFELEKMDQPDEAVGSLLEGMRVDIEALPDLSRSVKCPRCGDRRLMRQQYKGDPEIPIDKCPVCGGVWLDYGQLFEIRSINPTTEQARAMTRERLHDHHAA